MTDTPHHRSISPVVLAIAVTLVTIIGSRRLGVATMVIIGGSAIIAYFVWLATAYRRPVDPSLVCGFERTRLARDVLFGFALIPASLVFIFGGTFAAGRLVYGAPAPPYLFGPLPLPAALYGVLVFPFVWGLTEQMT